MRSLCIAGIAAACTFSSTHAQFNPQAGQWLKSDPNDIRVVTWNVFNILSPGNQTGDVFSPWNGAARIIASLEPDVIVFQEVGDGASIFGIEQMLDDLRYGNTDGPGGTSTVVNIADLIAAEPSATPGYNLPYHYIASGDGFNNNTILSRFPIVDINGDGLATRSDFGLTAADQWANPGFPQSGSGGGIRGFSWVELDLPFDVFAGDLIVANSHLKAFGDVSSYTRRVGASRNISYFIEYYWNGGPAGVMTDPNNVIGNPSSGLVLDPNTIVVYGGDWNNDTDDFGDSGTGVPLDLGKTPDNWMIQGLTADVGMTSGGDGPDRDGTDNDSTSPNSASTAFDLINGGTATRGGSVLDYIAWQDSVGTARRTFVYGTNVSTSQLSPIVRGFPFSPQNANGSDHIPVVVDLILPKLATSGPPLLSGFGASPVDVAFNQSFTVSVSVFDPDGPILGNVDFHEDSNNNGVLDPSDQLIASIAPSNPTGTSIVSFMTSADAFLTRPDFDALVGSSKTLFASATAADGTTTASTIIMPIQLAPTVDTFTATPSSISYNQQTTIDVAVSDSDGGIASVELYFDTNDNNVRDAGDTLLSAQTPVGSPAMFSFSANFTPSAFLTTAEFGSRLNNLNRFFLVVEDSSAAVREQGIAIGFVNTPPSVDTFVANPNPVAPGDNVTVNATVSDFDGNVISAIFVLDDGDGIALSGSDTLVGFFFNTGPYQFTILGSDLALGNNDLLLETVDNSGDVTRQTVVIVVQEPTACLGDGNGDAQINGIDIGFFVNAFNTMSGDANFDPAFDFNNDNMINGIDIGFFVNVFNTACP